MSEIYKLAWLGSPVAAKLAGLKKIPYRIIKGLNEEQRRLIENIHHEPLTDLEKAEAIKKLMILKN
jgi:ParB-like chromosome segregation protein Spo0J